MAARAVAAVGDAAGGNELGGLNGGRAMANRLSAMKRRKLLKRITIRDKYLKFIKPIIFFRLRQYTLLIVYQRFMYFLMIDEIGSKSLSDCVLLTFAVFRGNMIAVKDKTELMDEHLAKTLEQAKRKLAEHEQAAVETKKFINQICQFGGIPPMYSITDEKSSVGLGAIRSDSFYGRSATTAVREFLEMRRTSGLGAATHGEIIEALKTGGFDFSQLSQDDAVAQRTVAITLGKNSSIFHKLPNGNWGLLSWYPEAREKKQKRQEDSGQAKAAEVATPELSPETKPAEDV